MVINEQTSRLEASMDVVETTPIFKVVSRSQIQSSQGCKILWYSGRYLHLRTPAQVPYRIGMIVADSHSCENLPRSYTNLVVQGQMAAVVRICLDII